MKNCKKIVLKTHPDKSQLDKKYFLFFTKAYKLLFQIYTFRHKINVKQEDFEKDYDPEYDIEKENDEIVNKIKSSKNFNKLFNEIFENMSINNNKNGYGDWFKNETSNLANLNCKNIREMRNVINKKKSTMDVLIETWKYKYVLRNRERFPRHTFTHDTQVRSRSVRVVFLFVLSVCGDSCDGVVRGCERGDR